MLGELVISFLTAIVSLVIIYLVMKKAVKNGVLSAYDEIKEKENVKNK